MDARFNRETLTARITALARYSNRVTITESDGVQVAERSVGNAAVFVYADPPYPAKGADLYLDTLTWADHARLARVLLESDGRWIVSYGDDHRIYPLYPGTLTASFSIGHRVRDNHPGREVAFFAPSRGLPSLDGLGVNPAFLTAIS